MKTNSPNVHERGLQGFLARHGADVTGVLHGFDRVRFQGCLRPLYQPDGMSTFLQRAGVLRKEFREYVRTITGRIRTAARRWAEQAGRPQQYLASSSVSKEELVSWRSLRRGVADLHRRSEVCRAVNERYLEALTAAPADLTLGELLTPLCKPVRRRGRRQRGLRPLAPEDLRLLKVISQGDWLLEGFRNRDVRALLFPAPTSTKTLLARQSSATTRRLAFLRAHGLIRKIRSSHRYQITSKGRRATNALFTACSIPVDQLERIAA